jgi:hypothetical protein
MDIRKTLLSVCMLLICTSVVYSQTIDKPNYALKSHKTLEISSIRVSSEKTVVSVSIENRKEGGNFCADRNIYIVDQDGEKLKLINSEGIPVCPDTYKFKNIGEILSFTLEFPSLKSETKWIDIVEECDANCFWFYGVTLDSDLNKRLDEVFLTASKSKSADNIILFKTLLDSIDNQNIGIEGLLYINIISAAIEDNNKVDAMVWYKRLASSHAPRLSSYIKHLNDNGIKY